MKDAGKIILVLVLVLIGAIVFACVRPYWNKYRLTKDLEATASYGTKNSVKRIEQKLDRLMEERGLDLDSDDFDIEKEKDKTVTIAVVYDDYIGLFGLVVKNMEFEIEVTEYWRKEKF